VDWKLADTRSGATMVRDHARRPSRVRDPPFSRVGSAARDANALVQGTRDGQEDSAKHRRRTRKQAPRLEAAKTGTRGQRG